MAEKDPLQLSIRLVETAKSSLGMPRMSSRMFVSLFGCSAYIAAFVWIKIVSEKLLPPHGRLHHLLWTLYWLKTYSTNDSICSAFRIGSDKTFTWWRDRFVEAMAQLDVVSRNNAIFFDVELSHTISLFSCRYS